MNNVAWVSEVLRKIEENFQLQENTKASVTLPKDDAKENVVLVFSFCLNDVWYGFGITPEDKNLSPDQFVDFIKENLFGTKNV